MTSAVAQLAGAGASCCSGTLLFSAARLSRGCPRSPEEPEICFVGKDLARGAGGPALLPSLLGLWPVPCLPERAAVQRRLGKLLLLPPRLSGLQGELSSTLPCVLRACFGKPPLIWL